MPNDKNALEYSQKNIEILSDICLCLFQNFPIKTFGYRRFFDNGRYLALSNHERWQEYYFSHVRDPNYSFSKAIQDASTQHYSYFLWPQYPNQESIFQALYEHNIWHGLSIYRKRKDSVECFAFATTKENSSASDFYNTKNLEILKKFIEYFKTKAHDIIDLCPEKALGHFETFQIGSSQSENPQLHEDRFLNTLNIKKIPFRKGPQECFLTKQEWRCLSLLAIGNSMKETAAQLMLSERTVESYLKNISLKLGNIGKSKMIELFRENKDMWG